MNTTIKSRPCTKEDCNFPRFSKGFCKYHQSYVLKEQTLSLNKEVGSTKKVSKNSFLRPISEKKQHELKEYRILRDGYMKANPICEVRDCNNKSVDLHHKVSRAYALCDTNIFMAVCRECHLKFDTHTRWARENGYILSNIEYIKKE